MKRIETHETNETNPVREPNVAIKMGTGALAGASGWYAAEPGTATKTAFLVSGLKWLVGIAAVAMCFRGQGQPFWWLMLGGAPIIIHAAVSREYRLRLSQWLRSRWSSLEDVRLPGSRLPWMAAFLFVVLPAGLLFLSNNRNMGTGDTWPVMPTAASLVRDGDWDVREYLAAVPKAYWRDPAASVPYCAVQTEAGVYSSYPSGMVPFALPVTAVARLTGAHFKDNRVLAKLEKWTGAWLTAGCLGLFFLIALHLAEPLPALVATVLLATGSVLFSTVGQALWQHGGIIFWSLVILLVEFRLDVRPFAAASVWQGGACAMMLACRLSAVLFVVPLGVWLVVRSWRRAAAVAGCTVLAFLPWAVLYQSIYGTPFGPSSGQMAGENWSWNIAAPLAGLLVSPGRGVLIYQPWLALIVLGCAPLFQKTAPGELEVAPAGWQWLCAAVIGLHLVLLAAWHCWWGGHCWGSRLAAEIIPLAALLCVRPVARLWWSSAGKAGLAVLLLVSFLLHAPAVYKRAADWDNVVQVDRNPRMLWSWSRAPFLYPWQRQGAVAGGGPGRGERRR